MRQGAASGDECDAYSLRLGTQWPLVQLMACACAVAACVAQLAVVRRCSLGKYNKVRIFRLLSSGSLSSISRS